MLSADEQLDMVPWQIVSFREVLERAQSISKRRDHMLATKEMSSRWHPKKTGRS